MTLGRVAQGLDHIANDSRMAERQTRFHLVARCPTWRGQARVLWKRAEKLCEWERPRPPEVRLLFDDVRTAPECSPSCGIRG